MILVFWWDIGIVENTTVMMILWILRARVIIIQIGCDDEWLYSKLEYSILLEYDMLSLYLGIVRVGLYWIIMCSVPKDKSDNVLFC